MEPTVEYVSWRPPPALRPVIARATGYWLAGFASGVHVGLPSPHLTLILTLDEGLRLRAPHDPRRGELHLPALVGGLHAQPVHIHHDGRQVGIQLSLTPYGARALFGMPAAEVTGTVVPLDAVLAARHDELIERVRGARTWSTRFAVVGDILQDLRRDVPAPRDEVVFAWRRLTETNGAATIGALASATGWSRRHLSEQFRNEYGVPPKTLARMARFHHAQRLLREPHGMTVGMVAAVAGYADQAHLTREWHEFAGSGPTAWLSAEALPFMHGRPARDRAG